MCVYKLAIYCSLSLDFIVNGPSPIWEMYAWRQRPEKGEDPIFEAIHISSQILYIFQPSLHSF